MYGEFFDVPQPDDLVFVSSFAGGEVFRSGLTYRRGRGRVFYFSPGDQEYPVYHHPQIRRVLANRSEEHTSELQSLMRISYAVFCLKKKSKRISHNSTQQTRHI